MTIIIQAVEAGGRSGGKTFQLLNLLVRNLPIWHFQMLTGMSVDYQLFLSNIFPLDSPPIIFLYKI